jgi:nitrite reductase/ring-hydroxylating ferredoxin subunit
VSPILAFLGVSILGTWGLAAIGLIAGGIILLFFPGETPTASGSVLPGIVMLVAGLGMGGVMTQIVMGPLLGQDPPIPIKKLIPASKLTRWVKAGNLRDYPDGTPKEVRLRSKRVLIIRDGDKVHAMGALCSHARLPLGGMAPIAPIKAEPIRDGCVTCPFHGARFDIETGRVVRQPFDSSWNQQHPILGGLQSKLWRIMSAPPIPVPKPSMHAEVQQTYPCKIEGGEIMVALPPK